MCELTIDSLVVTNRNLRQTNVFLVFNIIKLIVFDAKCIKIYEKYLCPVCV